MASTNSYFQYGAYGCLVKPYGLKLRGFAKIRRCESAKGYRIEAWVPPSGIQRRASPINQRSSSLPIDRSSTDSSELSMGQSTTDSSISSSCAPLKKTHRPKQKAKPEVKRQRRRHSFSTTAADWCPPSEFVHIPPKRQNEECKNQSVSIEYKEESTHCKSSLQSGSKTLDCSCEKSKTLDCSCEKSKTLDCSCEPTGSETNASVVDDDSRSCSCEDEPKVNFSTTSCGCDASRSGFCHGC